MCAAAKELAWASREVRSRSRHVTGDTGGPSARRSRSGYVKARYYCPRTAEGFRKALELFEAAIGRDQLCPGLGRHGGHLLSGIRDRLRRDAGARAASHAKAAALRALELDDTGAHASLAQGSQGPRVGLRRRREGYRKAIALDPSSRPATLYSELAGAMGRLDEAQREANRPRSRPPLVISGGPAPLLRAALRCGVGGVAPGLAMDPAFPWPSQLRMICAMATGGRPQHLAILGDGRRQLVAPALLEIRVRPRGRAAERVGCSAFRRGPGLICARLPLRGRPHRPRQTDAACWPSGPRERSGCPRLPQG